MERLDRIEKIIEDLANSQVKTDEQIADLKESQIKTDEQIAALKESQTKTGEQLQETDARLKNLAKKMEGFLGNYGEATEELFYRSLEDRMKLGNIAFDRIERRVKISDNHTEFDIVLFNGECIGIIEVKSKAHPKDIKEIIRKKILHFKIDYPEYSNFKFYFGIASLVTNQNLITQSKNEGIFLLTQKGEHLEVINSRVKSH